MTPLFLMLLINRYFKLPFLFQAYPRILFFKNLRYRETFSLHFYELIIMKICVIFQAQILFQLKAANSSSFLLVPTGLRFLKSFSLCWKKSFQLSRLNWTRSRLRSFLGHWASLDCERDENWREDIRNGTVCLCLEVLKGLLKMTNSNQEKIGIFDRNNSWIHFN